MPREVEGWGMEECHRLLLQLLLLGGNGNGSLSMSSPLGL